MFKNHNSKIGCKLAIGQHLTTNPEYTDDNFRVMGQASSSFHLSVLESVYIKTQNLVIVFIWTLQLNDGE